MWVESDKYCRLIFKAFDTIALWQDNKSSTEIILEWAGKYIWDAFSVFIDKIAIFVL